MTRGLPTAHSAPPLSEQVVQAGLPLVWPYARGTTRGESVTPLYKTVPEAAARDERMYRVLAVVEALRVGRARERSLAEALLGGLLDGPG